MSGKDALEVESGAKTRAGATPLALDYGAPTDFSSSVSSKYGAPTSGSDYEAEKETQSIVELSLSKYSDTKIQSGVISSRSIFSPSLL